MFGKGKVVHKWKPVGPPIITEDGKIYMVEYCEKTGMYRYIKVPSFAQLEEMEGR